MNWINPWTYWNGDPCTEPEYSPEEYDKLIEAEADRQFEESREQNKL